MAIYWTSYSAGNVFMMQYNYDSPINGGPFGLSQASLRVLQTDLEESFNDAAVEDFRMRPNDKGIEVRKRNVGPIQRAYVFTWDNMKNGFNSNKVIIYYTYFYDI